MNQNEIIEDFTKNMTLLGNRVLIKLQEAKDHSVTSAGVYIPLTEIVETDGGRVATTPSSQKYLYVGTVVSVSPYAASKLLEEQTVLSEGDTVYLSKQVIDSKAYSFSLDRSQLISDIEGYVCIPHNLIEAKINENNQ